MSAERIAPDAILVQTALTGVVGSIDEDPDSPDANWLTYDSAVNNNTDCRVSFPSPSGNPSVGAGLQNFRVQIRKNASGGNATVWSLQLWENGAQVAELATGTTTSLTGEVVAGSWNASSLGTADGSLVECRLQQTSGGASGGGSNRRRIEIGAIEWNAEVSAAERDVDVAITVDAGVADGVVDVVSDVSAAINAESATVTAAADAAVDVDATITVEAGEVTAAIEHGADERTVTVAIVAEEGVTSGGLGVVLDASGAIVADAATVASAVDVQLALLAAISAEQGSVTAALGGAVDVMAAIVAEQGVLSGTIDVVTDDRNVDAAITVEAATVTSEIGAVVTTLAAIVADQAAVAGEAGVAVEIDGAIVAASGVLNSDLDLVTEAVAAITVEAATVTASVVHLAPREVSAAIVVEQGAFIATVAGTVRFGHGIGDHCDAVLQPSATGFS